MTDKKTYLIIDTSNMLHRAWHVTSGDVWTRVGLTIHIMLNSIRKSWIKFDADHVIFCIDGRSWRRSIYEPYKANRAVTLSKKSPQEQEEDQILFAGINNFIDFIDTRTNCTVLRNEICEADDLIARFIQTHTEDKHIIVSGDTDFIQLVDDNTCIYDGVKEIIIKKDGVYNERDKKMHFTVKSDTKIKVGKAIKKGEEETYDPEWIEWALFLKFVRGDSSDNIFSAYPRAKVTLIRKAFEDRHEQGYEWNNFMNHRWRDHNENDQRVKFCYKRNQELIDLTKQPDEIKQVMDETLAESLIDKDNKKIGLQFLKFAGKYELVRIAENPTDYTAFLGAKYS